MGLICRIVGHRWVTVWEASPSRRPHRGAPFVRCTRCQKIGWRVA